MNASAVVDHIVNWLADYSDRSGTNGFVLGISGGIDSAVTSTLCAKAGKPVLAISMPIRQHEKEYNRAQEHLKWLTDNFPNVTTKEVDLTHSFEALESTFPKETQDHLSMANARSRLRMLTLYTFAGNQKMLVAGTGNKVEDFGVGFYTKYGDGGVDLSPIADLMKSEVYTLGKELNIIESIQNAAPTDGLWDDDRSDEDQIGATYDELEWAMEYTGNKGDLSERQQEVLAIYNRFHSANKHKMVPIPICEVPKSLR
jgi:NAD+ synthase